MIKSFKHKGLEDLFKNGSKAGINPSHHKRIFKILSLLNIVESLNEFNEFPGFKLHPLKGDLDGYWSVTVTGNFRIIFKFVEFHAYDVDLVDYHS